MSHSADHIHCLDQRLIPDGDPGLASAQPMNLWVPSERVAVHHIEVPTAPERKWPELVPWMLEDRILQPVDEMHFVIGGRVGNNQLQILAVSRQDMQDWQRVAVNAGVAAISMVPDFLALPWEAGRICIGWREGVCLVRHSAEAGFAAKPASAWAMIDSLIATAEITPRLSISIPDSALVPDHLQAMADINAADIDWQFADMPPVPNLMTGNFKAQQLSSQSSSWKPVVGLVALSLALLFAYLQISSNIISQQIEVTGKQVQSSYSSLFTGRKPKPLEARDAAEQQLSKLFKQQRGLQAAPVAALIALDGFMTSCGCNLSAMTADEEGIRLHITDAEKLTSQALNIPGYQLSIQPGETAGAIVLTAVASSGAGGAR
ncbi:MAG: type II secretion system protein GspL [Porticoccaceae bacterium]|nr:type II secretion system protein GspL [Porticoccaceae bacterium]